MPKPITHQLRQIMRNHDRRGSEIWTNRYARSVSVKCYAHDVEKLDDILMEQLDGCCRAAGVTAEVYLRPAASEWSWPSIIVRLPL